MKALGREGISRRAFLRGGAASAAAVGAMSLAPTANDSYLAPLAQSLGPRTAYAKESFLTDGQEFVFEVVGVDEVGIQVVDPTKTDDKGNPVGVPNAIVILASTDDTSIPQAQKHTDEEGKCILNINKFCPKDEEGQPEDGIFQANVSVTVTSDDGSICDYFIPSMLVTGATAYYLAVEPYEGKPYLLTVAFNKQDILHDHKDFLRSPYNKYDYEICVRIKGATDAVPVSLTFYRTSDKTKPLIGSPMNMDATLDSTGSYAEAIFTGKYLCSEDALGLPADDISIIVAVEGVFSYELSMKVIDAPSDAYEYPGPLNTLPCLPSMPIDFDIKLGDDEGKFGWFKKMNVSMITPPLPFHFYIAPCYFVAGFSLDAKLAKWNLPSYTPDPAQPGEDDPDDSEDSGSSEGPDDPDDRFGTAQANGSSNQALPWGYTPSSYAQNWEQSMESDENKLENLFKNHAAPILDNSNPPNACRYTRFGAIAVDLIIQGLYRYKWGGFASGDYESKQYSNTGSVMVSVSVSGSYTWVYALGAFPFFITLSACVSAGVGYTRESTHETIKLSDGTTAIDTDHAVNVTNNALAINIGLMFRVSAGMGISGVASVGVSATVAFNPSLIYYEIGWEDKPSPHKILPLNLSMELVAQLLFFKVSVTVLQYKTTSDNWEDEAAYELQGEDVWRSVKPRFALTHPGENSKRHTLTMLKDGRILADGGGDPFASMIPVDQDMIAHSLEAKGLQRSSTSNEEYIATAYMDKLPCLVKREDGGYDVKLVDAPGHHAFAFGDVDVEGQAPTQDGPAAMFSAERLNEEVRAANGTDPYREKFSGLGKLVAEEYDYDYSDYNKTTRNVCDKPGVRGIAPNDGIQPSADVPIFEGVFSDARIKVVEIAGTMYQFRISTIEYGQDQSIIGRRGRLTASRFNADERIWEDPVVLEYSTGDPDHRRVELCDYDYDIITRSSDDPWVQNVEACVVVISGTMGTDFYESASNQMLNVLLIDKDLRVVQRAVKPATSIFGEAGVSYTIMAPRIADGFGLNAASGALGISFLVRSAGDKTHLMGTDSTVRMVMAQCFLVGDLLSLDFKTTIDDGGNYMVLNPTTTDLVLSASGDDKAGWMRIIAKGAGCYEGWSAYMESGVAFNACRVMCNVPSVQETLPNIRPWNTHGTFLYVRDRSDTSSEENKNDYYLYSGTFDLDKTQEALSEDRVDRAALKGSSFCVSPNGNWLFYFESYRGDPDTAQGPEVVNPDPSLVITGAPDLASDLHHMMACYLVNGKFCEDFVICDLDHPVDDFAVAGVDFGGASIFTTLEITDADKSIGTVRYLAIPYVSALEVKALTPSDDFIIAGTTGHFQIDVFNHGNVIITGFTATMHDKESGTDLTYVIDTIEPSNIRVNSTNGKWAESIKLKPSSVDGSNGPAQNTTLGLSDEAASGWLMPGKLMSYVVSYDIPADWHDERTVTMELTDYKYVKVEAVSEAPNAELVLPYYLGANCQATFGMYDHKANGVSSAYLPAKSYGAGSGTTPGGSGANGGGANGGSRQVAPGTGDRSAVVGPVAMAVGGLGALAAAYAARRARAKREKSEE